MDKTIKTAVTIAGGTVLAFVGIEALLNNITINKNYIPPEIEIVDKNNMRRLSYVHHSSLFRSAISWYDRIIEDYEKTDDGDFKLTKRITINYNYPILGLGQMTVNEKTENFKGK